MSQRVCCNDCGAEFIYCDRCEHQLDDDEIAAADEYGFEHLCAQCYAELSKQQPQGGVM